MRTPTATPKTWRRAPLFATALLALSIAAALAPNTLANRELEALKSNTDRWIDIRSRLSNAENNWNQDEVVLANSIATLTHSLVTVSDSVRHYENENRDLQQKLEAADARLQAFDSSNQLLLSRIIQYEERIRALSPRLPAPLQDRIAPLARRMPSIGDASTEQLPNRLQNVVAIMTLIDEFNKNLTLVHTIKTVESGGGLEVRVLYWGLAGAYAANPDGSRAWTLRPADGEWEWVPASGEDVSAIAALFAVHDKSIDPLITPAPFSLARKEAQP